MLAGSRIFIRAWGLGSQGATRGGAERRVAVLFEEKPGNFSPCSGVVYGAGWEGGGLGLRVEIFSTLILILRYGLITFYNVK